MTDSTSTSAGDAHRILSPLLDLVFKQLFEDELLLRSMLEAVLGMKNIASLEILNPGLPSDLGTGKLIVLDVRVCLDDNSLVDIEMQGRAHTGFASRILLYWARLYSQQLDAGSDYGKLRPARIICWVNDTFLPNERFHNVYEVRNAEDHGPWPCSHLALHTLELPKLQIRPSTTPEALTRWARFFSSRTRPEFETLAQEDPIMEHAKSRLERLSADPKTVELARERERNLIALGNWAALEREEGREEGLQQGLARGLEQGQRSFLCKLLQNQFGELPTPVLEKIAQASEEQLFGWASKAMVAQTLDDVFSEG